MTFNQFKVIEGEIEQEERTIHYKVCWVRDVPRDTVQIDEIEDAWVINQDGEEDAVYLDDHKQEIDDLIIEDAYKHEPDYWEQPTWNEWKEAM